MFGVISDTHYHLFTLFAGNTDSDGCNARLKAQLDATWQAAVEMKERKCEFILHCGDMFHVRGQISPVVLNHVKKLYDKITTELALPVFIIAGNHDLETQHSVYTANASTALVNDDIVIVCSRRAMLFPEKKICMISWHDRQTELMNIIEHAKTEINLESDVSEWTLAIHAPLNNVIAGIPETGIEPADLESMGFGLVLSGHYHNHKKLTDHVYSVGALIHHNWGDAHSLAGFLIVDNKLLVTHYQTKAPRFVDLKAERDESNIAGNYVRIDGVMATDEEITQAKLDLVKMGAMGVVANIVKAPTATSTTEKAAKLDSLEISVADYALLVAKERELDETALMNECADLLSNGGE